MMRERDQKLSERVVALREKNAAKVIQRNFRAYLKEQRAKNKSKKGKKLRVRTKTKF